MIFPLRWKTWALLTCSTLAIAAEPIQFGRDVLPILSDRCFHCHGPDASHRKADLRLDLEAKAKRDGIIDTSLESSELWARIISEDEDELMPPPDSHRKPLTSKERAIIKAWIEAGAPWGKHWAFESPKRPAVPKGDARHPIDAFIQARLAIEHVTPAPLAEQHTLVRRLSYDLTGLPPTPGELDKPVDWAERVEQKLASPHHGERMAMWWLDAARYSDTDGYQQDSNRSNWPWRDWVIQAFNTNMPYDQFTIEQFAGDLLPDATAEQILATCFHRNHMTNGEGGRHKEESRIDYVIDRVNTIGTVWLGLTLGCVQCHDHKFDPVSQRDYYSMFAFFNSINEDGRAGTGAGPHLEYTSPLTKEPIKQAETYLGAIRKEYATAKAEAETRFEAWLEATRAGLPADYQAWRSPEPVRIESAEGTQFEMGDKHVIQTRGPHPRQDDYRIHFAPPKDMLQLAGWKLEVLPHASHTDGKLSRGKKGEFILSNVKVLASRTGDVQLRDIEIQTAVASAEGTFGIYGKVKETLDDDPRKGWTTETKPATNAYTAVFEIREPLQLHPDDTITMVLFHRSTEGDANIGRFRISLTDQRGEAVRTLKDAPLEALAALKADEAVPATLKNRLRAQYLMGDATYQGFKQRVDAATNQVNEFKRAAKAIKVQVLGEREKPRDSHILIRGVWDAKGETVLPAVIPAVLQRPAETTTNRLALAEWIVSPDNPLTARVTVNHLWQMMFGSGLVRTPEDFGLQGEAPTHPELLDWLALELIENQWDLRHILRLIATSATYRQSSHATAAALERDPDNRLLARSTRYRLPAWMIRDSALASSGLLTPTVGGPPVRPWQPDGVWREIFMGRFTYVPSAGPAQYRRTLYAFWRRSSAPTFLFDSSQRRVCEVSIRRTNTPLHALTLLNDTTMLEAALFLGSQKNLQSMAKSALGRPLSEEETTIFERERQDALAYYSQNPETARTLTRIGQQLPASVDTAPEVASWMIVASMMLNLDEAMTRE